MNPMSFKWLALDYRLNAGDEFQAERITAKTARKAGHPMSRGRKCRRDERLEFFPFRGQGQAERRGRAGFQRGAGFRAPPDGAF